MPRQTLGNKKGGKTSKKKDTSTQDFVKVKRKVGKKRPAPQNETRTDFTVKRIQMPAQQALDEKGEVVTHRKLGLLELLAHLQHHSAKVRRDAFHGLRELCAAHEGVLRGNLARIFESLSSAPIDSSGDVRAAFRAFQSWLLESLSTESIVAFASSLALHVRSALSHVSKEVRADGLALLEQYLSKQQGMLFLNTEEKARVMETLCQQTAQTDSVLACLYQLLRPSYASGVTANATTTGGDTDSIAAAGEGLPKPDATRHVSLQAVLRGDLRSMANLPPARHNLRASATAATSQDATAVDSPVWTFCLRAWHQAGEVGPVHRGGSGGKRSNLDAAAAPAATRLRAVAVLERAVDLLLEGVGDGAAGAGAVLRPSNMQIKELGGIVRRGEWPLRHDVSGTFRVLFQSVNLRMMRILATLAAGQAVPADVSQYHLSTLCQAVLAQLEELSSSLDGASRGGGGNVDGGARFGGADAHLLRGSAPVAYACRCLDLLWSQRVEERHDSSSQDAAAVSLVATTARLVAGAGTEEQLGNPRSTLTVPLCASLLGLHPSSAAAPAPPTVQLAWPKALAAAGEQCFAQLLERTQPGVAAEWAAGWPKLLWHLGDSDPALSGFLLAVLLELAKRAVEPGSLHAKLFDAVCPLLVPFFAGLPGGDVSQEPAPPLARLRALPTQQLEPTSSPGGNVAGSGSAAQVLAPLLLQRFPRLGGSLLQRLAHVIRRWSDVGAAGDVEDPDMLPHALSVDCCRGLLEALLRGNAGVPTAVAVRLEVAFTVLCATPQKQPKATAHAVRGEVAALHLADVIAEWLMARDTAISEGVMDQLSGERLVGVSHDERHRLVLEAVAWPLCTRVLAAHAQLASRMLCFVFFCSLRLAAADIHGPSEGAAAPLQPLEEARLAFLSAAFDVLVAKSGGRAVCLEAGSVAAYGGGALDLPFCDPDRLSTEAWTASASVEGDDQDQAPARLACMLCAFWLRAVAPQQRAAAYELLLKLCTQLLERSSALSEQQKEEPAAGEAALRVLVASIAYRNAHSLPITGWGSLATSTLGAELQACGPEALRARLEKHLKGASDEASGQAPRLVQKAMAMMPLL